MSVLVSPSGSPTAMTIASFQFTIAACGFGSLSGSLTNTSACSHTLCDLASQAPLSVVGARLTLPAFTPRTTNLTLLSRGGSNFTLQCGCTGNWTGPTCSTLICPNNCTSPAQGQCAGSLPPSCVCQPLWGGLDCSIYVSPLSLRAEANVDNPVSDPLGGLAPSVAWTYGFTLWLVGSSTILSPLVLSDLSCRVTLVEFNSSLILVTYSYTTYGYSFPPTVVGRAVRVLLNCTSPSSTHVAQLRLPSASSPTSSCSTSPQPSSQARSLQSTSLSSHCPHSWTSLRVYRPHTTPLATFSATSPPSPSWCGSRATASNASSKCSSTRRAWQAGPAYRA